MKRTEHRETKWKFPFVKYTCGDESKKLPLILQLHGAGERGDGREDLVRVEIHGFAKTAKNSDREFMLVMPQCPSGSFWAARVESIIEFIKQLKEEYNIDEERIYLTGLSMGGFGTWYTAMSRPDLFAAIAPVCGGGMAWNAGVLTMPTWAFHGVEDPVVSVNQSDEMVKNLKQFELDITYSRLDGVYHDAWNYAYNEDLLAWLLAKKRKNLMQN